MSWLSLSYPATAEQVDALSDALMEAGALSVSIEDPWAGTEDEQAIFAEPGMAQEAMWQHSRVVALFTLPAEAETIAAFLAQQLPEVPTPTVTEVEDQDWVRLTQSQFDPIPVSPRLWIVPSWHEKPSDVAICIELDPGLAFGTGSHPTTRLCLRWLDQHLQAGTSVLDYGCGSGILAIAAHKLGAQRVAGVDVDPQAVQASLDNAQRNQCEEVHFGLPETTPQGPYQVVVANILTNPLCMLAPALAGHNARGGHLVLSGILVEQLEQVQQAYAPWYDLQLHAQDEGWACLTGIRL